MLSFQLLYLPFENYKSSTKSSKLLLYPHQLKMIDVIVMQLNEYIKKHMLARSNFIGLIKVLIPDIEWH